MNQIPEGLFSFFYIIIAPFVDSIIGPDVATAPANPLCSHWEAVEVPFLSYRAHGNNSYLLINDGMFLSEELEFWIMK